MLFMGEEYARHAAVPVFLRLPGRAGARRHDGRREEFAAFAAFADEDQRAQIPDPNAAVDIRASRLDWAGARAAAAPRLARSTCSDLLQLRRSDDRAADRR